MTKLLTVLAAGLLAGCAAKHTWAPGPNAQITDFNMQQARCRLAVQGGGNVVVNVGPQDAGAAIGAAFGAANRRQNNFNDCMVATGWQAVD